MAAAVVEFVQDALDRNEAPHIVRISRSTGCSLQDSENYLKQVLGQDKTLAPVHVVINTEVDPETNAIAGKTISLTRRVSSDTANLYAIYRSAESSNNDENDVDDALKNILWFPRLEEGLGASVNGSVPSDITCEEASGTRNIKQKVAESASVFADFKTSSKQTPSSVAKATTSVAKANKKSSNFFGSSTTKATQPKAEPPKPKNSIIVDSEEESEDDDVPKFVKKSSTHKRLRVCDDSSDDDDKDDPFSQKSTTALPKAKESAKVKEVAPKATEQPPPKAKEVALRPDSPPPATEPEPSQKRQKLVTKTRINEQGYMVTESVYEDVDEDEPTSAPSSTSSSKPPASSGKLPAPPPKKKRAIKNTGSVKQSSMMDFFGRK
ncbi:unnamed protein product [Aphanomyces euteiches]|uniref:DNA polymerase delta subunit 3 n=1 Tax=Aphanomyces euteiches TaxID=100861 RepID=A0A6G0XY74_9STRA|nr:hypothetical protein Ae201684_000157 [Aphanomyces euteiches]KAH9092098.1 hypothetical protein Ae201684P_011633 [Aphanomyces euteiches]KAH9136086.1 hypothetical protein AeRB84_018628 [Aphanomyces euteiches]